MNTNRYDPMPAKFGDDGEIVALVGTGKAVEPEPTKEAGPEIEIELAGAPRKRGRPAKKVEDEQGTTAKN